MMLVDVLKKISVTKQYRLMNKRRVEYILSCLKFIKSAEILESHKLVHYIMDYILVFFSIIISSYM